MPKAEVGSTKWVANKSKAKGLQRLRWYCQVCQKQCRDENGFKQHTLSEGHVRQMMLVGENPGKYIHNFSSQFKRDFLQLLRTSHGEKKVHINHFYQEYIRDKEHVHMNSTRWSSLTEFAKFLGREGICRVENDEEKGLFISWIDNSPEAIKRREDVKNKDRLAKGDEDLHNKLLEQQIRRAKEAQEKLKQVEATADEDSVAQAVEPAATATPSVPIKISFGFSTKKVANDKSATLEPPKDDAQPIESLSRVEQQQGEPREVDTDKTLASSSTISSVPEKPAAAPFNPFSSKTSAAKKPKRGVQEPEKKMSAAERIMREEMERKRPRDDKSSSSSYKRARYN